MEKQKFAFDVPADLKHSAIVRSLAEEFFGLAGFPKAWRSRLKLVVDELFMNAVKYGSTAGTSTVHMEFALDDESVKFLIEDDGTGARSISVEELQQLILQNDSNQALTKTSGRGLAMITKLWTDSFDIGKSQRGGIAARFSKKITSTPPPAMPAMAPEAPIKITGPAMVMKMPAEIGLYSMEEHVAPVYAQMETFPKHGILELDMTAVNYINSTFIGHLAAWYKTALDHQGYVRLKNANEAIRDVLDLVGLTRVLLFE